MENKSAVITRPNYDDTTSYLHSWASKVILASEKDNIDIVDLEGEKANRESFESVLKKKNPDLVFLNGHGSPDAVCGQDDKVVVQADLNEKILAKRLIYAVSCDSAQILGKEAVRNGAKVYIGYNKPFAFLADRNSGTTPLKDKKAQPFLDSSNRVALDMIRGRTAGEAFNKSQAEFERCIEYYSTSTEPDAAEIIRWLIWDKMAQTLIGDKEAIIV